VSNVALSPSGASKTGWIIYRPVVAIYRVNYFQPVVRQIGCIIIVCPAWAKSKWWVEDGMRLVSHGEPHSWCMCVFKTTWSLNNNYISIGCPVVKVFANHGRGSGFNSRYDRPLIYNNYFQFTKIEHALGQGSNIWLLACWAGTLTTIPWADGMKHHSRGYMLNHGSTMACVSSLTASRIADMCVCAETLEVEVTLWYQLVVQWLESSLITPEDSGSIPGISDH
jgi:hypothetical protein